MIQDYTKLTANQLEDIEKQTLRNIVQALQDYSKEAKEIFDNTKAPSPTEVTPLAEDLVQYALEVAEWFPINRRFAGFIDYKRIRWCPTHFGIFPQVLLVDAKASTENNRDTLQQSQLPMDAEFLVRDKNGVESVAYLPAGVPPHEKIVAYNDQELLAVTSSAFIHFYYTDNKTDTRPFRCLHAINVLMLPHQNLKHKYNPNPETTFFGQGKHFSARMEKERIRVYYARLRSMCPWRLQELRYDETNDYTLPIWRDSDPETGEEIEYVFKFLGR